MSKRLGIVIAAGLAILPPDANAQLGAILRTIGKAAARTEGTAARAARTERAAASAARTEAEAARLGAAVAGTAVVAATADDAAALAMQASLASDFKFSAVSVRIRAIDASVTVGPQMPSAIVQVNLAALDVSSVFASVANTGYQIPPDRPTREALAVEYAAVMQAGLPRLAVKVCDIGGRVRVVPSVYDICPNDSLPRFGSWIAMPALPGSQARE
jgi:hypothetical protein